MAYSTITLDTLLVRLQEKVGNNAVFWDTTELRDALNEALCLWQALTGTWVRTINIACDGSALYDIPKQLVSPARVSWGSTTQVLPQATSPLGLTSLYELDLGYPGWKGTTGTPEMWAPDGVSQIAVYPVATTGYLYVEGYQEAPTMWSLNQTIDIGEEELVKLLGYAQWYLTFKEGVKEGVDTVGSLFEGLIKAAGEKNQRLVGTEFYKRYTGEERQSTQRPPRYGPPISGVRGS